MQLDGGAFAAAAGATGAPRQVPWARRQQARRARGSPQQPPRAPRPGHRRHGGARAGLRDRCRPQQARTFVADRWLRRFAAHASERPRRSRSPQGPRQRGAPANRNAVISSYNADSRNTISADRRATCRQHALYTVRDDASRKKRSSCSAVMQPWPASRPAPRKSGARTRGPRGAVLGDPRDRGALRRSLDEAATRSARPRHDVLARMTPLAGRRYARSTTPSRFQHTFACNPIPTCGESIT